ncbi:MAG: hypothetical protein NC341_04900 [Blautia sp.]|nr:hypothetical protein [Blautia sp.]MCM1199715.1 hypothetical protein [Bacteroides fragilis]
MKKSGGIKIIVIGIVLAALVVGYYFYLSNKTRKPEEEVVESTQVQAVLMRDLEKNYPPTPKEVIKYFNEISMCFYNEKYTDEELEQLAVKIQGIYDGELIANKPQEQYMEDLRSDIIDMKSNDRSISSCQLPASTDVDFFSEDGSSCAKMYCTYSIRQGTNIVQSRLVFILRQDEDKHWKILGWDLDE